MKEKVWEYNLLYRIYQMVHQLLAFFSSEKDNDGNYEELHMLRVVKKYKTKFLSWITIFIYLEFHLEVFVMLLCHNLLIECS